MNSGQAVAKGLAADWWWLPWAVVSGKLATLKVGFRASWD